MRNVLLLIIAVLLALLSWCFLSLQHAQKALADCQKSDSTCHKRLKEASAGGVCDSCCQQLDPGPFALNGQDVVAMVSKYTTDHWMAINGSTVMSVTPTKDSRSMWLSLSRLKGFIHEIELESSAIMAASGDSCCQTLGVRIYLAEYRDQAMVNNFFSPNAPNNYLNKTTIVMIPTYRSSSDNVDHDFNPSYYYGTSNTFKCAPSLADSAQWGGSMTALTLNHGGLIPPPYPSKNAVDGNGAFIYLNSGADFMLQMVDRVYGGPPHPNPYWNQTSSNNWPDQ